MAKRRQFTAEFKAKVALEAIRGELTVAQIAKKYEVDPNMIAGWKRRLTDEAAGLFARGQATLVVVASVRIALQFTPDEQRLVVWIVPIACGPEPLLGAGTRAVLRVIEQHVMTLGAHLAQYRPESAHVTAAVPGAC